MQIVYCGGELKREQESQGLESEQHMDGVGIIEIVKNSREEGRDLYYSTT